jgi:hypothetical protein
MLGLDTPVKKPVAAPHISFETGITQGEPVNGLFLHQAELKESKIAILQENLK